MDDVHPDLFTELDKNGLEYNYRPDIHATEIPALLTDYEGMILRSKIKVDKDLLEKAPRLKWIARAGSGLDNIDEAYARSRNIELINVPEANADAVAEHTIGMMLGVMNNLGRADREVRQGIWQREANRGIELKGKTVAIIGLGHTGSAVARRLSGFGVQVLAYDKYKTNYANQYAYEASMERIFEEADVLTLHVPLTDETRYLVNCDYLAKFKKDIILLNLSRGKVVKLAHLVQALESGKVKAAALDVLENENLQTLSDEERLCFDYLCASGKTLLSPHIGGWTFESYQKISFFLSNKISYLANGFGKDEYDGLNVT